MMLSLCGVLELRRCTLYDIARATASSAFLVGLCWTNLVGLTYMSVPMYVVGRNAVPILTACGEALLLGASFGAEKIAPLGLVVAGSLLYSQGDDSWDIRGIHCAMGNALFVTSSMLFEKKLMKDSKGRQTPVEVNFYRCLTSLPMLVSLAWYVDEVPTWPQLLDSRVLPASCILAFGIGISSFSLQARVHATTIQVANVAYKVVTTLVSLMLFPVIVTNVGWTGYVLSFVGFGLYCRPTSRAKQA